MSAVCRDGMLQGGGGVSHYHLLKGWMGMVIPCSVTMVISCGGVNN